MLGKSEKMYLAHQYTLRLQKINSTTEYRLNLSAALKFINAQEKEIIQTLTEYKLSVKTVQYFGHKVYTLVDNVKVECEVFNMQGRLCEVEIIPLNKVHSRILSELIKLECF